MLMSEEYLYPAQSAPVSAIRFFYLHRTVKTVFTTQLGFLCCLLNWLPPSLYYLSPCWRSTGQPVQLISRISNCLSWLLRQSWWLCNNEVLSETINSGLSLDSQKPRMEFNNQNLSVVIRFDSKAWIESIPDLWKRRPTLYWRSGLSSAPEDNVECLSEFCFWFTDVQYYFIDKF